MWVLGTTSGVHSLQGTIASAPTFSLQCLGRLCENSTHVYPWDRLISTLHFIHYVYLLCMCRGHARHIACGDQKTTFFLRWLLPGICYGDGKLTYLLSVICTLGMSQYRGIGAEGTVLTMWWTFSQRSSAPPFKVAHVWSRTGSESLKPQNNPTPVKNFG